MYHINVKEYDIMQLKTKSKRKKRKMHFNVSHAHQSTAQPFLVKKSSQAAFRA